MRLYVLPSMMLGTLLLLSSCSAYQDAEIIPPKTFHYAYQQPSRIMASPELAKQLTQGKTGQVVTIRLSNKTIARARLGNPYYSANGNTCRKYTVLPGNDYAACKVGKRWYQASPIISDKSI